MPTTIERDPLPVNDSGNCTDGTAITREWWITHLDAIDAALAALDTMISGSSATGSWSPTDISGAGLVLGPKSGTWIKVGPLVILCANIYVPANANGAQVAFGGVPFLAPPAAPYWGGVVTYTTCGLTCTTTIAGGQINIYGFNGVPIVNSQLSGHEIRMISIYPAP